MYQSLSDVEAIQLELGKSTDKKHKSELGQFMTSFAIAQFMASLFTTIATNKTCKILDAGAGVGALSHALINRYISDALFFNNINLSALEIDSKIHKKLMESLSLYETKKNIQLDIKLCDFIEDAVNNYIPNQISFSHVILNPPYKKINSSSYHRHLLRKVGIETVNLYSAFVALSILLLEKNGQLVAIIPRSFCNGPYYQPFRELILNEASIKHIHLFGSRNKAFKDDGVLQENIIIYLERAKQQDRVLISTSSDDSFSDYSEIEYPFKRIVNETDSGKFIHIPTSKEESILELSSKIRYSLSDLDIQVSTGPIVDFRIKEYLRKMPEEDSVPLLYPGHFLGSILNWPNLNLKKANAIKLHPDIEKWLYPSGYYTVIKRFSSKEEKRRIMASILDPTTLPFSKVGFENHLNILHTRKQGLDKHLALGLTAFLNSTIVDNYFRQFNGHTQVNATDLRRMKFPHHEILLELGEWAGSRSKFDQVELDNKIETIL